MVTDGPIIREARKAAFGLVKEDRDLRNDQHTGIRKQFLHDYKDRLDMVKISQVVITRFVSKRSKVNSAALMRMGK